MAIHFACKVENRDANQGISMFTIKNLPLARVKKCDWKSIWFRYI